MQQAKQHIIFTEQSSKQTQHQASMSQHSEQHQVAMFFSSFSFISF